MEQIFDTFRQHFKEVLPLGNLHILENDNASAIIAIFLSLDAQGFNVFWQNETLQHLCEKYCKTLSFKGIMQVQYTLLLNLQKAFSINPKPIQKLLKDVLENLATLKRENITQSALLPSIEQYFTQLITQEIQDNSSKSDSIIQNSAPTFSSAFLQNFLDESLALLQAQKKALDSTLKKDFPHLTAHLNTLQKLIEKIENQHFSIGITGVLSAGKSTLLNALLGQEILGSSTIPETASLTLLKYAKTPCAQVCFWNKQEWEDVKSIIAESELTALFENTEFCEVFAKQIQDSTQSLDISLEELPKYTSANHPSRLCNLIKQTILFTPLKFLENSVEIVDTPGLDDPIVQREEITKQYLERCDLLIHAMNAAQSATQIDMDFILQTLQSANLSRILILLTHADLLEPADLQAALNYTKESIKANLAKNLPQENIALLLKRLDFIPLASYPALLCQISPTKAQALGFSLEDSNFNALIAYLNQTLLGKNSTKAKDLIYLCAQGFARVNEAIKSAISLEQSLLFAKEQEVQQRIQEAQSLKEQSLAQLQNAKTALHSTKIQLQDFLNTLQNQLNQRLEEAKNVLSERVFAEITYDYEKGKTPSTERLEYILDLGLKDTLSDILRFSAQSLGKKITQLKSNFESLIESLNTQLQDNQESAKNFNLYLNPVLLQKTKLKILNKILKTSKQFNKNQTSALKIALDSDFKEGFLEFIASLMQESQTLEQKYITHFTELLDSIQHHLNADLEAKDNILQHALSHLNTSEQEKQQREAILTQTLARLNTNLESLKALQHYATGDYNA